MLVLLVLLGILGFLLVYGLNESRRIGTHLRAGFVALFAFTFAVTVGRFGRSSSSRPIRFSAAICKSRCCTIHRASSTRCGT
jgi:hypothetical protein